MCAWLCACMCDICEHVCEQDVYVCVREKLRETEIDWFVQMQDTEAPPGRVGAEPNRGQMRR